MKISRREFVSASSMSVAVVGFGQLRLLGQTPAAQPQTPAAQTPPTPKWEDIRRGVGIFTASGGTIGYLVTADAVVGCADGALHAAILNHHLHEVMRAEGEMHGRDPPALIPRDLGLGDSGGGGAHSRPSSGAM